MSTGKRLAKRSILGTRVCAPRADRSGLYLCGVIQASRNDAGTREDNIYRVFFDEDGNVAEYSGTVLVGPGFKSVPDVALRAGQVVYVTHNGREVRGTVSSHTPTDEVDLTVFGLSGGDPLQLKKRLDEIRLIESRKSARLQDSDTDYSRLAEGDYSSKIVPPPDQQPRRRASSLTIDVPFSTNHSGGRKRRSSADDDGVMDDCMAAMVLMSLSCSPKSSGPHSGISLYRGWGPTLASSGSSSGASSYSSSSSGGSSGSTRATPSPPSHLLVVAGDSSSSLLGSGVSGSNTGPDEGIEVDDSDVDASSSSANFDVAFPSSSAKRKSRTRVVFQCTWPGCGKQYELCHEVEKHVRTIHLGGNPDDEQLGSGGEEEDHEEEFYYTEIEVEEGNSHHHSLLLASPNGDSTWESSVMAMPSSIYSSSVPTLSHLDMARPAHENPEYRKQQTQVLSPNFVSTATPISIPQLHKPSSAAWHLHGYAASAPSNMGSPQKCMRLSPKPSLSSPSRNSLSPLHHHNNSSSSSSSSRRTRSESRKCRKVYGMENRDMWCTQCKWKKACTRFVD